LLKGASNGVAIRKRRKERGEKASGKAHINGRKTTYGFGLHGGEKSRAGSRGKNGLGGHPQLPAWKKKEQGSPRWADLSKTRK